jgi:hypothetical protein
MHKIYLVLRNNQQSGPYSLEELLQLPLKPHDLVWVEGQSAGWRYPEEIDALKPHIQNTSQPLPFNNIVEKENTQAATAKQDNIPEKPVTPRHIYVSLPAGKASPITTEPETDPLEKKAQELYQRVQAYNQTHQATAKDEKDPHPQPRTVEQMRQDYEAWMTQQKKKKKQVHLLKQAMAVVMVFLILTTGFVLAQWIVLKKDAARQNNVSDPQLEALPVSNDSVTRQQLLNNFTSNKETYLQAPTEIILDATHYPNSPQSTKDVASENKNTPAKEGKASTLIVPHQTKLSNSSTPLDTTETYQQPAIETTTTAAATTKETSNEAVKEDKRIDSTERPAGDGQKTKARDRHGNNAAKQQYRSFKIHSRKRLVLQKGRKAFRKRSSVL